MFGRRVNGFFAHRGVLLGVVFNHWLRAISGAAVERYITNEEEGDILTFLADGVCVTRRIQFVVNVAVAS